jgi:hypothetical protein
MCLKEVMKIKESQEKCCPVQDFHQAPSIYNNSGALLLLSTSLVNPVGIYIPLSVVHKSANLTHDTV